MGFEYTAFWDRNLDWNWLASVKENATRMQVSTHPIPKIEDMKSIQIAGVPITQLI